MMMRGELSHVTWRQTGAPDVITPLAAAAAPDDYDGYTVKCA